MRRIAPTLCLAALLAPHPALAQFRAERDGARAPRVDALAPPEDPSPGAGLASDSPDGRPAWTLDLLLPLYFDSNPEKRPRRARGTGEATPEPRMGWSTRLTRVPVQLSVLGDMSNDRFCRASAADADIVYLRVRAPYDSGEDDQEPKPFLDIQPTRAFAPGFASCLESRLDVDVGFTVRPNLDRSLRRRPRSPFTSAIALPVFGSRQRSNRRAFDSDQWGVGPVVRTSWCF